MAAWLADPVIVTPDQAECAGHTYDVIVAGLGTAPVLSAQQPTPGSMGHLPSVTISFEVD